MPNSIRSRKTERKRLKGIALILCLVMMGSVMNWGFSIRRGYALTQDTRKLACPYAAEGAEPVAHCHNGDCYDGEGRLICTLKERDSHIHGESCYAMQPSVLCGMEESEEHRHTESCFGEKKKVLFCTEEELPVHVHSETCFQKLLAVLNTEEDEKQEEEEKEKEENTTDETDAGEKIKEAEAKSEPPVPSDQEKEISPTESTVQEAEKKSELSEKPEEEKKKEEQSGVPQPTEQEEKKQEENQSEQNMPAVSFDQTAGGIRVQVEADEGTFPENTYMSLSPVNGNSLRSSLPGDENTEVMEIQAIDISFVNGLGEEIEPLLPVRVTITLAESQYSGLQTDILHFDDDGNVTTVAQAGEGENGIARNLSFEADSFSTFAFAMKSTREANLNRDGDSTTTSATIQILWEDKSDVEELRPETLTATLYKKNGSNPVRENISLSADQDGNWSHTETGLEAGEYRWAVQDSYGHLPTPYYKFHETSEGNTTTITYGLTRTETVHAVWDVTGHDEEIPSSNITLKFNLKSGGTPVTIQNSGNTTWRVIWNDESTQNQPLELSFANILDDEGKKASNYVTVQTLQKYSGVNTVEYSWEGYELPSCYSITTESQQNNDGSVNTRIKIHYTEAKTSATVTKVWDDGNDNDKIRPSSLSVALKADGTATETRVTLNAANYWTQTVSNLKKYQAGVEIAYTWDEGTVAGYTLQSPVKSGTTTTLTNKHTPVKSYMEMAGETRLSGRAYKSGDSWTYTITPQGSAPKPKNASGQVVTNVTISPTSGNSASVNIGKITFTPEDLGSETSKVFFYTVVQSGSAAGVTNDSKATRTVKILVTKQEDGSVIAEYATGSNDLTFRNTYSASGSLSLSAVKKMIGRKTALKKDEFSFELLTGTTLLQTKKNDADGKISFDAIDYTLASMTKDASGNPVKTTKTYFVREKEPAEPDEDLFYDGTKYTVTVTIEDNKDGTLAVTATPNGTKLEFENIAAYTLTYDPNGGKWSDGSKDEIEEVYPVTEAAIIRKAPTRSGYEFVEWEGSSYDPGDTYDETDDDGYYVSDTLKAKWKVAGNAKSPGTGDHSTPGFWAASAFLSAMGLIGTIRLLKKRLDEI